MGKGKGRASARNTLYWEIQQEVGKAYSGSSSRARTPTSSKGNQHERPRLKVGLAQLRNLLRERQFYDNHEWMQQRRRGGFLLDQNHESLTQVEGQKVAPFKPLGSLILSTSQYESSMECSHTATLQNKCLQVLGEYLVEYINAMGMEELHAALSLLPGDSLAELSVFVSKSTGVDNRLAFVLGRHRHVEALCFCAPKDIENNPESSLTDRGLLDLLPKDLVSLPNIDASWEDIDDEDNEGLLMALESSVCRLKKLELVDCPSLTASGIHTLLEKSPFITHLSLAGCLNGEEGGIGIIQSLPKLLPALHVLDITRCSWATSSLVEELTEAYESLQHTHPLVHFQNIAAQASKNAREKFCQRGGQELLRPSQLAISNVGRRNGKS
eukprot:scaffold9268_cov133-Cylindrotheca_fusiformis.AAC.2